MLPLLPLAVFGLGGLAFHQSMKREKGPGKGVLTAERQNVFEVAVRDVEDPEKLRAIAKVFREQGLPAQADMLEKRAQLRELPEPVKQARRAIFKKAMKSTDPNAVRGIANAFEKQGATGAAATLRNYAAGLPIPIPGNPEPTPVQPAAPPPPPSPEEHNEEHVETVAEHAPEPEMHNKEETPVAHGDAAEPTEG